jgi:hypothetical protein
MWDEFKELSLDSSYTMLKQDSEKGITSNVIVTSPLSGQRINITGYRLDDCYYFSSSVLPDKNDLLDELRSELGKRKY